MGKRSLKLEKRSRWLLAGGEGRNYALKKLEIGEKLEKVSGDDCDEDVKDIRDG